MACALNVKTACLETLNGERERSWDGEVTCLLDANYADWKNPLGTYMVPREFTYRKREPDVGEQTEKMFFNVLETFGKSRSEPMFVIHAYNFAEISSRKERKWVVGEHDFVIIHRQYGIIFFQVNIKYYQR